jgi:hypothetical protein
MVLEYSFGTVPILQPLETFMAIIVKRPASSWKAVIRKTGWPTTVKIFRT